MTEEKRAPRAPRHLRKEARAEWRRVIGPLVEAGIYTPLDRAALALYCAAWGDLQQAIRELRKGPGGPLAVGADGAAVASAWIGLAKRAMAATWLGLADFGVDVDALDLGDPEPRPGRLEVEEATAPAPERAVIR